MQDARRLDTVEEERVSSLAPAPNDHQDPDALSDLRRRGTLDVSSRSELEEARLHVATLGWI